MDWSSDELDQEGYDSESSVVLYSDVHDVPDTPVVRVSISPLYRRDGRLCSPMVTTTLAQVLYRLTVGRRLPEGVALRVTSFVVPFEIPQFRVDYLRMAAELWPRTLALEEAKLKGYKGRLCDWESTREGNCWDADEITLRDLRIRETNVAILRKNCMLHTQHFDAVRTICARQRGLKMKLGVPLRCDD